ncbi:MAG: thioesterase family protein [Xanthobacteraceae bacterium]|nr:thioesterase family protein [Xanthobacteraceae bacterium]
MDAIFRVEGTRVTPSPYAAGPWDPTMQHGSAPSSLVAWAAEAIPTPAPMRVARLTIDLMRPVPLTPLSIETEVLREGRKIQLSEVRLRAGDTLVVQGTVLKIRCEPELAPPAEACAAPIAVPGPDQSEPNDQTSASSAFVSGMSIRAARGRFAKAGQNAIWYRVNRPLVEGAAVSPVMRAVAASDFCNATGVVLDFRKWTFINADLTISLARQPVGEWILLDAETWVGPDGAGLATARLGDSAGYFGRAIQSLVVARR